MTPEESWPWLEELTDKQKYLFLICFSVSCTMGVNHPFEMYAVTNRYLLDPYINSSETADDRYHMADDLIGPMIVLLKHRLPGYDHVNTKEDFLEELKKFYDGT